MNAGVNHYDFSLTIICRGLYAPQIVGSTQTQVLAASQAAVDALAANANISVSGDVRVGGTQQRFQMS